MENIRQENPNESLIRNLE